MSKETAVGIDIGTYHVKVVVSERTQKGAPRIRCVGYAESRGLRYGYIINTAECTRSIRRAVRQAEKAGGISIKRAHVSIGGVSLESIRSRASVVISRGDNEVTELDINRAQEQCEENLPKQAMLNRKVLHAIPQTYKIDGKEVLGNPIGMKGLKLEVETLFITCLEQHLNDLMQCVEGAGVEVEDVYAAPIAASIVTLTKAQKIAGCVLVNIGSQTVSMVVYEEDIPIALSVFPVGSTDITNDIALGLKVSLEEAEQIKLGGITATNYSRKKLDEIMATRLNDIFELIEAELKKIRKDALLPAGIVMTGGGSGIATIEDLAKAALKLPSKIGALSIATKGSSRITDSTWSVAYGLSVLSLNTSEPGISERLLKDTKNTIFSWFRQFLP